MTDDLDQGSRGDIDEMGPIDYIVVEFPGSKMTGEGFPLLVDLVDRGIIRIIDLAFLTKELDGTVRGIAISDFDGDGELDLAAFEGASSGLLGEDDIEEAGSRPRAGQLGRAPRLRERVGRPLRRRDEARRRPARGQRSYPRPGTARGTRRRRRRQPSLSHEKRGREMPGLIRGVARTAVIAGTATAVSNRVSRRQAGRWAAQEQQQAPSSSSTPSRRRRRRRRPPTWTTSWPSSRSSAR